ncbi:hypothetical protein GSY69_13490 [Brevibacterium sp. 5221]|uniref:Cell division protein FtsL n=1 Tax=Brevibacterium rongguiense TaxID=2695267 RepID=A0A6N9HAC4_9MICO|nr:hypothetical protein [Brevibacterium rongguiense]MYM20945.1 hypothetical protein [Brevibacterium rongguiense]
MSSVARAVNAAPARRTRPAAAPERARLRLVVPGIARRRVPFSGLCVAALVVGLLGVLLANIYISHSTYRVQQLSAEQQQLHDRRDELSEDISYRSSPQNIQRAALQAGMVRAKNAEFIRRSDGSIISAEKAVEISGKTPETVPGPRADTRDDPRPNLRSDDRLPTIGGSGTDLTSPSVHSPNG